jgi:hypothetical protein
MRCPGVDFDPASDAGFGVIRQASNGDPPISFARRTAKSPHDRLYSEVEEAKA